MEMKKKSELQQKMLALEEECQVLKIRNEKQSQILQKQKQKIESMGFQKQQGDDENYEVKYQLKLNSYQNVVSILKKLIKKIQNEKVQQKIDKLMNLEQEIENLELEKNIIQEKTSQQERKFKVMIRNDYDENEIVKKRRELEQLRDQLKNSVQQINIIKQRKIDLLNDFEYQTLDLYYINGLKTNNQKVNEDNIDFEKTMRVKNEQTIIFENNSEVDQQMKDQIYQEQQDIEQQLRKCKQLR